MFGVGRGDGGGDDSEDGVKYVCDDSGDSSDEPVWRSL